MNDVFYECAIEQSQAEDVRELMRLLLLEAKSYDERKRQLLLKLQIDADAKGRPRKGQGFVKMAISDAQDAELEIRNLMKRVFNDSVLLRLSLDKEVTELRFQRLLARSISNEFAAELDALIKAKADVVSRIESFNVV